MEYYEICQIFESFDKKNTENINKFISFIDFALNEDLINEHKKSNNYNPLKYFAINTNKEFKPVADYLFKRFPQHFDDELFFELFSSGYNDMENQNITGIFREFVSVQRNDYRRRTIKLQQDNLYYLDYFNADYIQHKINNIPFLLIGIKDNNSKIIDALIKKGITFKAEHFMGSDISDSKLSKYINIEDSVNNILPPLFKDFSLSLKDYRDNIKNKNNVLFNFLHDYYYNMGTTYLHNIRDFVELLKSNHEKFSTYKFNGLSAAELILYREFSMIKKMVDMNKFKISTVEEGIKLKKYLESNKYLKNTDNLIEKLKIFALLKSEDTSVNETIINALNIISPYSQDNKFIDHYIMFQEKVPYPKPFHSDIPKNIIPLIGESFSGLDLKQQSYFFEAVNNKQNRLLNMLPTFRKYKKGELIRPEFFSILNEENKGKIVTLALLQKDPDFFYGFKNDDFREKNKNSPEYQIYHESELLWEATESINKRTRDITP